MLEKKMYIPVCNEHFTSVHNLPSSALVPLISIRPCCTWTCHSHDV